MKQFSKDLGNVSLAPKGKWSREQEYERLALVYNACDNLSYVAKTNVPSGIDIENREYWQPMNATGYADNNFINLTAENENGTITVYETLEEAVVTILPINRKAGATLSFYNLNADRLDRQAEFELWQFNSTDLANWENRDYWNNIYYNWNVFAGWYVGADALKNHVKIPNVGQYAYVGTNLNDALLYQCRTNGTWTNTGIKVRNYISVVVSGNITIGENGNWFSDGEDTGIPATPAVDEQLDNIIIQLQQHATEIDKLQKQDVVLKSNIDSNFETINNKVDNIKTATDNKIDAADANLQNQITSNDTDIATLNTKHESLSRTVQGIAATGGASTATNVTYDNDTSGLNAENAQDAINELQGSKIDKTSILQKSGYATDKVMSQKAVSDKLSDLANDIIYKELAHRNIRMTEDSYFSNKLSPSVANDLKIGNNGEPIILTGSDFIIKIFDVSNYKQLSVCLKKYADNVCMFMKNRSWVNPNNNIVGNVIKSEVKGIITVPEDASLLFVSSTKSETEDYVYGLSDKTTIPSVYDGICCATKTQEYTSMSFLKNQILGKIELKNDVQYLISIPSKNVLLINKKIVEGQNFNGVSVSYDENKGCIKINGTSNGYNKIAFVNYNYKIPKGVYTMYSSANLDIVNFIFNDIGIQSGSTRTIEISEDAKITPTNTFLSLLPNVTYNNVEVYLQIEKNNKFSGFCPNKMFFLSTDRYGNVSYYPRLGFCIEDGFIREYYPSEKLFFDRIKDETDCSFAFNDDINEPVKITTTPYVVNTKVSIIDFGAKGDGVTDDTFAFEKALENSKNVFIPSGTYLISRTLYLKSGTELYGEGDKSIIKLNNPSNLDAVPREDIHQTFTDKYVYPYIVNKKGATDIYIHNLKIEGCEDDSSFTTNLQIGVLLIGAKNSKLEFLHVSKIDYFPHLVDRTTAGQTKLKSYNIGILSCDNIRIENCISEYGGYECCRIGHDSKHVTIKNCQFNYGWRTCLQIIWGCENIVVDNCQILQDDFDICDTHAFMTIHTLKGCFAKNIHIKNCSLKGKLFAEGNDLGCFSFVDGYNENVTIENCDFELEGEYPNQSIAIFDLNGNSFIVKNNRLKGSIRGITHTTTNKDCSIWIEGNIIETKQKSICLIPSNSYKYAKIDKNIIKSYGVTDNDGIYVYTTDECRVENLAICNNVVRAGSYGIDLSSKNVEYARISDNTILETTTPIRCLHATKSIISNNILNNSNSKIGENNNSVYQNTIVEN